MSTNDYTKIPTTTPPASLLGQPTLLEPSSGPSATNLSRITDPIVNQTEETPPNHNCDSSSNHKNIILVGIIVAALLVAIIITLALVLGFAVFMKIHKNKVPMVTNEACGTRRKDTVVNMERIGYDYPSIDDQAIKSIDTTQNKTYAINAEAKPCVAYATNISTEGNDSYGINLQGNTYDYPTMDDQVGECIATKQNEAYATSIKTKAKSNDVYTPCTNIPYKETITSFDIVAPL